MNRIVLADDAAIFRAGAARVLAVEEDMRIVAQCEDAERFRAALAGYRGAVALFSSGIGMTVAESVTALESAGCVGILLAEKTDAVEAEVMARLGGSVGRKATHAELVDCVRRVGRGQRGVQRGTVMMMPQTDTVGARVRDRLTLREMQIVGLILEGCKNKQIAVRLGTKEQVVKNYLRVIYDKTGVGDRLELALFTLHHKQLAEAARRANGLLQLKSA